MHGSRWQGLETDVATDGELCTTGKPAWNRRAPALRHAPRQPLTLLEACRDRLSWSAVFLPGSSSLCCPRRLSDLEPEGLGHELVGAQAIREVVRDRQEHQLVHV